MWHQQTLTLSAKTRGFHLITDEIIAQLHGLSAMFVSANCISCCNTHRRH